MTNKFFINPQQADMRLDRFIRKTNPDFTQGIIESHLRKGNILVNGAKQKANYRTKLDDEIILPEIKNNENKKFTTIQKVKFDNNLFEELKAAIIFQNHNMAIINKPAGLATQGGSGISHSLDSYLPNLFPKDNPKLVHRLDKDTSGAIIIALNDVATRELAELIKNKQMTKTYLCVVVGSVKKLSGEITMELNNNFKVEADPEGKTAITKYHVIDRTNEATLLEMQPITGRKHQLRVTCLEMGHPILGDGKYGGSDAFLGSLPNKLHLHSYKISIPKFLDQESLTLTASLNDSFKKTINLLEMSLDDKQPLFLRAKKWAK
jgi:23S rRNA pseudouridine955/2504/2580 synthase